MPDDSSPASHFGTAYWIAVSRARESERVDHLPDDPYPTVLAGTRGRAAVDRLDQVVLLGAALDTRAFRLPCRRSCAGSRPTGPSSSRSRCAPGRTRR